MFVGLLRRLRNLAHEHAGPSDAEGFTAFTRMFKRELAEEYLASSARTRGLGTSEGGSR
jgi:hypothetical protein